MTVTEAPPTTREVARDEPPRLVADVEQPGAALRSQWDALAEAVAAPPFAFTGWVEAWLATFAAGRRLSVHTVRCDGRLEALVPLLGSRTGLRSLTNWHTGTAGMLARSAESAERLHAAVLAHRPHMLTLGLARPDAWEHRLRLSDGYRLAVRPVTRSPYVETDATWDEYRRGRSKNLMKSLRRRRRRLEEHGRVGTRLSTEPDEAEDAFAEFVRIENTGWKRDGGTALAGHPELLAYYGRIVAWAAERGWLRLRTLRLDDRPIAAELSLSVGGVEYGIKAAFDDAYAEFSPGMLLLEETLRALFESDTRRLELLGADEPYKMRWADDAWTGSELRWFAPTLVGHGLRLAHTVARPVARRALRPLRARRQRVG